MKKSNAPSGTSTISKAPSLSVIASHVRYPWPSRWGSTSSSLSPSTGRRSWSMRRPRTLAPRPSGMSGPAAVGSAPVGIRDDREGRRGEELHRAEPFPLRIAVVAHEVAVDHRERKELPSDGYGAADGGAPGARGDRRSHGRALARLLGDLRRIDPR